MLNFNILMGEIEISSLNCFAQRLFLLRSLPFKRASFCSIIQHVEVCVVHHNFGTYVLINEFISQAAADGLQLPAG